MSNEPPVRQAATAGHRHRLPASVVALAERSVDGPDTLFELGQRIERRDLAHILRDAAQCLDGNGGADVVQHQALDTPGQWPGGQHHTEQPPHAGTEPVQPADAVMLQHRQRQLAVGLELVFLTWLGGPLGPATTDGVRRQHPPALRGQFGCDGLKIGAVAGQTVPADHGLFSVPVPHPDVQLPVVQCDKIVFHHDALASAVGRPLNRPTTPCGKK